MTKDDIIAAFRAAGIEPTRIARGIEADSWVIAATAGDRYGDIELYDDAECLACISDRQGAVDVWDVLPETLADAVERIREHLQTVEEAN